jgi:hypothetical protein
MRLFSSAVSARSHPPIAECEEGKTVRKSGANAIRPRSAGGLALYLRGRRQVWRDFRFSGRAPG